MRCAVPRFGEGAVAVICAPIAFCRERESQKRSGRVRNTRPPLATTFFSSISKHTSIDTRCSDDTKRPAGLPPRLALPPPHLALPPRLALQRRRSTRRRSSRCDGSRHTGRGESQVRNHQRPELSDWPGACSSGERGMDWAAATQKKLTPMTAARERSLVIHSSLVCTRSSIDF